MTTNFTATQVTKTAQELIYSVSNALRILGKKYHSLKIEVWSNCIWVWGKSQVCKFVSKNLFKRQFVSFRQQGSKVLEVTKDLYESNVYHVYNPIKDSRHHVTVVAGHVSPLQCTCADYNQQLQAMGKGCCKHAYALLTELGYSSLSDYIAATS
jgi:predicted nucleic acid-binding Zn finger protein